MAQISASPRVVEMTVRRHDHDTPTSSFISKDNGYGTFSDSNSQENDSLLSDPELRYSSEEERRVIHILDTRLFPWILLTTFVLNMDRTNISNAISDNLPQDLGFTIDTVNTATAIYAILFACFCVSGAVVAKIAGPARCILSSRKL